MKRVFLLIFSGLFLAVLSRCMFGPNANPPARPIFVSRQWHFGEFRWLSTTRLIAEAQEGRWAGLHNIRGGQLVIVDKVAQTVYPLGMSPIEGRHPSPLGEAPQVAYLKNLSGANEEYRLLVIYDYEQQRENIIATGLFNSVDWLSRNTMIVVGRPSGKTQQGVWVVRMKGNKLAWDFVLSPHCYRIPHIRANRINNTALVDCLMKDKVTRRIGILNINNSSITWFPRRGYMYPVWTPSGYIVAQLGSSGLVLIGQDTSKFAPKVIWQLPINSEMYLTHFDINRRSGVIAISVEHRGSVDLYELDPNIIEDGEAQKTKVIEMRVR